MYPFIIVPVRLVRALAYRYFNRATVVDVDAEIATRLTSVRHARDSSDTADSISESS